MPKIKGICNAMSECEPIINYTCRPTAVAVVCPTMQLAGVIGDLRGQIKGTACTFLPLLYEAYGMANNECSIRTMLSF